MPLLLFVAFIVVPLVELAVIGQVNDAIGLGWTLTLLLADSVAGALLVRREGSRAWSAFRAAIADGRVPGDELLEGVLLLFGGALLLTPGFVTDALGLALVLPLTRRPIARVLRLRFVPVGMQVGTGAWNATRVRARRVDPDVTGTDPGVEVLSIERESDDGSPPPPA